MSDDSRPGTVGGMLAFTDFLIDKNYAPRNTVKPLQTAIERVFSTVHGEEYRSVDVQNVDMDDLMRRFTNATGNQYKAESRATYRARLMRITGIYGEHLANPDAPPNIQTRTRGPRSTTATEPVNGNGNGGSTLPPPRPPSTDTRSYSLPLRNGDATLTIPREFYAEDAERLSKLIETLVFEPMRQLPSSTSADGTEETAS